MALPALMAAGAVAGGVSSIIGSIIGAVEAGEERKKAEQAVKDAMKELENTGMPQESALRYILSNPQYIGQFSPKLEEVITQTNTELKNIAVDPRLKEAQMSALESLKKQGESPLTDIEKASLNEARRDVAAQEQARQASIIQSLAQRGQAGSGAELAQRLLSSQAAANRSSEETDRLKSMAQQRALQAIAQGGSMAGQMSAQEFSEQARIQEAQDAINRFNVQQRAGTQTRNVDAENRAALRDAMEKQRISEVGVANANEMARRNAEVAQLAYRNRLEQAQMKANTRMGEATQLRKDAASTAENWSKMGSGVGQAAASGIAAYSQAGSDNDKMQLERDKLELERQKLKK